MANRKTVAVSTPAPKPTRNDPRVSGKTLTSLPTYNGREYATEDSLTKAIIRNVRSRRAFNGGREFINRVVASMAEKHPTTSLKSLDGRVCRVLARYF